MLTPLGIELGREFVRPLAARLERDPLRVALGALTGGALGTTLAVVFDWYVLLSVTVLGGMLVGAFLASLPPIRTAAAASRPARPLRARPSAPGEIDTHWYHEPEYGDCQITVALPSGLFTYRGPMDNVQAAHAKLREGEWPEETGEFVPYEAIDRLERHQARDQETEVVYDAGDQQRRVTILFHDPKQFEGLASVIESIVGNRWVETVEEADLAITLAEPLMVLALSLAFTGVTLSVIYFVPARDPARGISPLLAGMMVAGANLGVAQWLVYRIINRPTYRALTRTRDSWDRPPSPEVP